MPEGAIPVGLGELGGAAAFVLLAGLISLALRLGLERRLLTAAARGTLQLFAVGGVLGAVFAVNDPRWVALLAAVMMAFAARAAVDRSRRRVPGSHLAAYATLVVVGGAASVAMTGLVLRVEPWWRPRYLIPLLGMILGNALTGLSLALDEMLARFDEDRDRVELELALGATAWEAARLPLREAVRRGMVPILNSLAVVGVVALPGMMTGQILQGADPNQAVRYQLLILFVLAGATSLGCVLLALFVFRAVFDEGHRLRFERITRS
jgi:putative ABC transport system permease protein